MRRKPELHNLGLDLSAGRPCALRIDPRLLAPAAAQARVQHAGEKRSRRIDDSAASEATQGGSKIETHIEATELKEVPPWVHEEEMNAS
jgi:hypothetical protein